MTHWGTIDRDINLSVDGHVKIFEFLGRGPQSNYLSKVYQKIHGRIFWCPMESTPSQKMKIIQEACRLQIEGVKYDFKSTWKAALGKIFLDAEKFNCSEGGWWLWRKAAMVKPLFDEKDPEREIAPVPGDMPYYSGTKRIVELIMG